jgi:hypothetical protein
MRPNYGGHRGFRQTRAASSTRRVMSSDRVRRSIRRYPAIDPGGLRASSSGLTILRHLDDLMACGQDYARINSALATLVLMSLLATSGCSTIFNGTGRDVSFTSNVRGAEIYVEGKYVGKTPIIARVGHGLDKVVEARKPGYVRAQGVMTTSFNSSLLWLLFVPGFFIINAPFDAVTGAMFLVDESSVRLDLTPLPSPAEVQRPTGGTVREPSSF